PDLVPHIVVLVVLLELKPPPRLVDSIEEPLDIAAARQKQLLLLDVGHPAGSVELIDVQPEIRIEPVARSPGSAGTIEDPLIELFDARGLVDDDGADSLLNFIIVRLVLVLGARSLRA